MVVKTNTFESWLIWHAVQFTDWFECAGNCKVCSLTLPACFPLFDLAIRVQHIPAMAGLWFCPKPATQRLGRCNAPNLFQSRICPWITIEVWCLLAMSVWKKLCVIWFWWPERWARGKSKHASYTTCLQNLWIFHCCQIYYKTLSVWPCLWRSGGRQTRGGL